MAAGMKKRVGNVVIQPMSDRTSEPFTQYSFLLGVTISQPFYFTTITLNPNNPEPLAGKMDIEGDCPWRHAPPLSRSFRMRITTFLEAIATHAVLWWCLGYIGKLEKQASGTFPQRTFSHPCLYFIGTYNRLPAFLFTVTPAGLPYYQCVVFLGNTDLPHTPELLDAVICAEIRN